MGRRTVCKGARGRRGTLMVEGALIFPLVLLAVFTLLYMTLVLYSETVVQAEVHMAAREGAGRMAGTVYKGQWGTAERQEAERGESGPELYFRQAAYGEIAEQVEAAVRDAVESAPLVLEIVTVEGKWEYGLLQPRFYLVAEAEAGRKWLLEEGRRRWFAGRAALPGEAALARNADWLAEQM